MTTLMLTTRISHDYKKNFSDRRIEQQRQQAGSPIWVYNSGDERRRLYVSGWEARTRKPHEEDEMYYIVSGELYARGRRIGQ
jgi:hypothetical protein